MSLFEKLCGMLPPSLSVTAAVNERFNKREDGLEQRMFDEYKEFVTSNLEEFRKLDVLQRECLFNHARGELKLHDGRVKELLDYIEGN